MTTAVYFDLDGTLCTYAVPFADLFEATVSPYGESTDAAYETYVDRLLEALERCEADPYREAFEAVAAVTRLDAAPETLAREYRERELEATTAPAAATRTVERVAETRPTGILTNGDGRQQRAKVERHGFDESVDEVVVSSDVGAWKPDRRIFDAAMERLPADEYVFVGDDYEADIVGAHDAGFRTVYVTRADDFGGDESAAAADAVVSSVESLLDPDSLPEPVRTPFESSSR
ncbi:HAD family hydrolase [Haloterrigena sp. SYSU A558-1]|uniref:HAD family hydrolase n=1 Tax=Haloterrigena gelatinilytica TaxID=2741724 RepID=A0A8J8KI17_9EURY|nr:HAD family hydrolase [Haloterrigena gelatinilytica]NUB91784.1 HAD family hydrolase [Haloterrigena gelatinilytica]NUC72391.1 HAD family hydrolase [Haloterrigena gelatinilytica]